MKNCVFCGKETGESPFGEVTYCSHDCALQHEIDLALISSRAKQIPPQTKTTCEICGKEFDGVNQFVVCSDDCLEEYIPQKLSKQTRDTLNRSRPSLFYSLVYDACWSKSKIVEKGWGFEIHLVNHKDYCCKFLVFFPGKRFSWHKHFVKKELFQVLAGQYVMTLQRVGQKKQTFEIKPGDKLEINPGDLHQVKALDFGIILEVSTQDFPEDSIRIEKGD